MASGISLTWLYKANMADFYQYDIPSSTGSELEQEHASTEYRALWTQGYWENSKVQKGS